MPVKLIDWDLSEPLQAIWGMEGYEGLSVLVRYHGKPIGWAYAVGSNRSFVSSDQVLHAIDNQISWQCVEAVLGEGPRDIDEVPDKVPPISVIVCCGDLTRRITDCLTHLRQLAYPQREIIVVDYGAHPQPAEVYEELDWRVIRMEQANLSVARNRGITEARHDIVAFIDADGYPDREWLNAIGRAFRSPGITAVCGLVVPTELETPSQFQFDHGGYGFGKGLERRVWRGRHLDQRRLLQVEDFGSGANMAFRRSVLDELGAFDPRYGIDLISGGSEVELLHRLLASGHTLLYEPSILTWHAPKRDPDSLRRIAYEHGKSAGLYLFMCFRKHTVRRGALIGFLFQDWAWRRIFKRLLRPGKATRTLVLAELAGAFASPLTFLKSRKRFGKLAEAAHAASTALQQSLTKRRRKISEIQSPAPDLSLDDPNVSRITIVRTWYPHWGAYSGIHQYLRHLNRQKYRSATLLVHENDSQFPVRNSRLRDWLRYRCQKHDMAWYNLSDLRAEFSILTSCIFECPDIVHYLDGEHAAQWVPRLSSLPARIRPALVVSYHQPPDVMEYAVRKETIGRFDHVIAVAPEQMDFLHRFTSPAKVSLILHGIDTEFFHPSPKEIATDKVRCISVGHNYRDYAMIRQVATKLKDNRRIEFHIVSPKATGLEGFPNAVLHNDVDDLGLLKLYQGADILFLPLLKATANNALLEGIACGLPVISTLLPSVKAYVPGPEAMLIDTDDPSHYADAVLALSEDIQHRRQMGRLARQRAEQLSWQNITVQYEALYAKLAGR
ncbi:glycosyltransferase [Nitrospira sp. Nam80]